MNATPAIPTPRAPAAGRRSPQATGKPPRQDHAAVLAAAASRDEAADQSLPAATAPTAWDDARAATKVTLLVLLALVLGCLVGILESVTGYTVWVMLVALTAAGIGLVALGRGWLSHPIERLAWQLEAAARANRPSALGRLPIHRQDEIGRIARAMQQAGFAAVRQTAEAKQLRRTLDARVSAETRKATRKLRTIAMRDPLTGLGNRRFLDEHFEPLVASCLQAGTDLLCIAIDMDKFKTINDTLGHDAGDELLIFVGNLLRASIRREDFAIRLGGDEFLLLLPGADISRAQPLVSHLQALYRQHIRTAYPAHLQSSLSLGIASLKRDQVRTGRDLVKKADDYLYKAKEAGRDRAVGM